MNQKTHLGVAIATYQRRDGRTKELLTRALGSIAAQNYPKSRITVFLVGDKYEDKNEFKTIVDKFSENLRIESINLIQAVEREFYPKDALWSYGGVNAINTAIEMAKSEVDWLCHLDHDDFWEPNHLSLINEAIENYNPAFVYTKSVYLNKILPDIQDTTAKFLLNYPEPYKLIHSSVCMNITKIPLLYPDLYKETRRVGLPADAAMWISVTEHMLSKGLKSIFINRLTCVHEEEGYERNK